MAKIMEIIEKETRGKCYHTYKYSYDSIGLPSIDYDDDPLFLNISLMAPVTFLRLMILHITSRFFPL